MLLKVLQRELVHKLRQFTPQGIENVLWAFATLGHHPGPAQDSNSCVWVLGTFRVMYLRLATVCLQSEELLVHFHSLISVLLLSMSVLPSAMLRLYICDQSTTFSFAAANVQSCVLLTSIMHAAGDEVLAAAASHVHSILHQFNQQNLALTLWAFAKLAWCPPTDLLSDAASLAVASLHTSNSQNLSNTLWAFATLGFMPQAGLLEVSNTNTRPMS